MALAASYGIPIAISVYHRASDLWRIPQLVLELTPDYDLYLRQHDGGIREFVDARERRFLREREPHVTGLRKRHADNAALGRGIRGLTDLSLERGHGCGVDDHAALSSVFSGERLLLGDPLGRQPQHVERADQIDLDDLLERV